MSTTPIPYGANPDLDELYDRLSVIEQHEIDAMIFGRRDLLPEIREKQLPLKRQINEIEGSPIYPEAA
jgi:hypothetical protein